MSQDSIELLRGTLDVLLLRALLGGPRHGYGLADWIHGTTGQALVVDDGALYTALHRMEDRGLVRSEWGVSEKKRRAKFYALTPAGHAELERGRRVWESYAEAVEKVFNAEADPA
jgi:PadR family transcriptional regulator PadR